MEWKPEPAISIRLPLQFDAAAGKARLRFGPAEEPVGELGFTLSRDGRRLLAIFKDRTAGGKLEKSGESALTFWPPEKDAAALVEDGLSPQTALGRPLAVRVDVGAQTLAVWVEGRLVARQRWAAGSAPTRLEWQGEKGAAFGPAQRLSLPEQGRFEFAELPGAPASKIRMEGGIPFAVGEEDAPLSLAGAGWPDWKRDPGGFNQAYDGGPEIVGDRRMPFTQIPNAAYTAAYVLARSRPAPGTVDRFTLRLGRRVGGYTSQSQVLYRDFTAAATSPEWRVIRVPLGALFPTLVEGETLDLELTREIRLARRQPDPNSFRWRPLGLPSNVEVAAITLEKSPVKMSLRFPHFGQVFEKGESPSVEVRLHNPTAAPVSYRLEARAGEWSEAKPGTLAPGASTTLPLQPGPATPGVHPLELRLVDTKSSEPWLTHATTYAMLPKSERRGRETSPIGIGGGGGGKHFTPVDGAALAELGARLGFRYLGGLNIPPDARAAHGMRQGMVLSMRPGNGGADAILQRWDERLSEHPDQLRQLLVFHEDGISGSHASRLPDLFHDRPPYILQPEEKKRFDELFQLALRTGKLFREHHPDVQIQLGNGGLVVREELYRNGFPGELFDTGGNENPTFSRPPETQPPDPIGNNSSLWMDRQMLDHYGYAEKPVTQCHETLYPSANPGNLSRSTQADYLVRHYLHSLAWRVPQIRGSALVDKGNSYKNSNWGQTGLFTARPEVAPKPAAVRMAVLTAMLDEATYDGFLDTGSEAVYTLRFTAPGGSIYPFWTVRGKRPLTFELSGEGPVVLVSADGAEETLTPKGGRVAVSATASPAYLRLAPGASVRSVACGTPEYPPFAPVGKLTALGTLREWALRPAANPLLEVYNPLAPRRKGDFAVEKQERGLRVTPRPLPGGKPTMPMYGELQPPAPVELPGRPTALAVEVDGNASWGRLIVELSDASGQRWTSIGARSKKGYSPWMADWLGKSLAEAYEPGEKADWNTDDAWGLSRINFDGWHVVAIPLPGNYPGEGYPWPANSQWRWDKEGQVHYPLRVEKVIVELPEKTLHLTRYAPARRAFVELGGLFAVEDPTVDAAKAAPEEYLEARQIRID